jgi:hypothetical protein
MVVFRGEIEKKVLFFSKLPCKEVLRRWGGKRARHALQVKAISQVGLKCKYSYTVFTCRKWHTEYKG